MDWRSKDNHSVKVETTYDSGEFTEVSIHMLARALSADQFTYLLDNFLNLGGKRTREGIELGKSMRSTHRSLQGNLVEFCLGVLEGISDQEYTDPRNETAIATAKAITAMRKDGTLEYQRYI